MPLSSTKTLLQKWFPILQNSPKKSSIFLRLVYPRCSLCPPPETEEKEKEGVGGDQKQKGGSLGTE